MRDVLQYIYLMFSVSWFYTTCLSPVLHDFTREDSTGRLSAQLPASRGNLEIVNVVKTQWIGSGANVQETVYSRGKDVFFPT
jgi:hypothetical protein